MELLIEREREAEALGGVIEAGLAGHGGALLIEGEAGIGKTRLLATARSRAAVAGARVLHASSDETEADVPLAAARALFARASRGIEMEGPARLGALALRGALADPAGPGSRADEVVPGTDLDGRPYADGLEENCQFFRLDHLDPDDTDQRRSSAAASPLEWLAAGSRAECDATSESRETRAHGETPSVSHMVDTIRSQIAARRDELRPYLEEADRLQRALQALNRIGP